MSFRDYIYKAFCDQGTPSSSRILTAITYITSCLYLGYSVFKTSGHFPDGMTLTGLGAFASSPYAVNRFSKMFGKDKDSGGDTTVVVKNTDQ